MSSSFGAGYGRVAARLVAGITLALVVSGGCGNPEEGTVTVSPEARARLRGSAVAKPTKGKSKLPTLDVREKQRRPPSE